MLQPPRFQEIPTSHRREFLHLSLAGLAGAGGSLWSAAASLAADPKKVALLVGVNKYSKRGFVDRPLKYAERDVDALAVELRKQGFSTVRVLKGSLDGGDRASKPNIDAAIQQLLKDVDAVDLVLLGFSGHGTQQPLLDKQGKPIRNDEGELQQDAFYCPVDAVRGEPESMVSLTELMKTLRRKGGINLVLVDACRDEPVDPTKGESDKSLTGDELNGRLPKDTALFFSCAAKQKSLETDKAGGGHGVFIHHVLEGLRGEAADEKGEVTWNGLTNYVTARVNDRAKEWFPDRAIVADAERMGELQTPHKLENMIKRPVLARVSRTAVKTPPRDLPSPSEETNNSRIIGTRPGQERDDNALKLKLVWCPPGSFRMGSPKSETGRQDDEDQVDVTLSSGFWLGKFEVTQSQYEKIMGKNPSYFCATGKGKSDVSGQQTAEFPVETVSYDDALEFCKKFTEAERKAGRLPAGWQYTLPTEAEWEYACRTQESVTPFSFGTSLNGTEANCDGNYPYGTTNKGAYLKRTTTVGSVTAQ